MFLLKVIISSLFLMSSLYLTTTFNGYAQISIIVLCVALSVLIIIFKRRDIQFNTSFMILFYLFTFFGLLSSLKNSDRSLILGAGGLLLIFITLSIVLPTITKDKTNKFISDAILITHIPMLVVSIILYPLTAPYKGVFYNPNSFGSVACTVYAVILARILINIDGNVANKKTSNMKTKLLLWLLILVFVGFFVIISGSRTSLFAIGFTSIIGIVILMVHLFKMKQLKKFIIKFTGLLIFFSLLIKVAQSYIPLHLYSYIFLKFERKSGDILDGRGDVWSETIQNSSFLGNGRNYFSEIGLGAHNTFISLLGQYGWATLIIFSTIIITGLFYAIIYIFKCRHDSYRYLPLLMILTFITLSMGEGMMFKLSMLATFACIGAISSMNRLDDEGNKAINISA